MQRFEYLRKRKAKALKAFNTAKTSVEAVIAEFREEIKKSSDLIAKKESEIEEERAAIVLAEYEISKGETTVEKINGILGA